MQVTRREALALGVVGAATGPLRDAEADTSEGWNRGSLRHLLPTASHRSFNIKLSFETKLNRAPTLTVGDRRIEGQRQDSNGRFWAFRVPNLEPDTRYDLQLHAGGGPRSDALCDSWPLRTLPAPSASPTRLRVAAFTCAGGFNLPTPPRVFHAFKPAAYRRRLFDLMLAREPEIVIANGDHVYFDLPQMERLQSGILTGLFASFVDGLSAVFNPAQPVLGSPNEDALTAVGDDQIAQIYGVRFRSTPIFFLTDDHDYFDNDDASPERVTMPPDAFHMSLRNALQRLYYPELIAEPDPGPKIPGRSEAGGVSLASHFGEVRYGDLLSGLLYDCSGYLGLDASAGLVPAAVEEWLLERTRDERTLHSMHVPSHPMGWTAGKWREWYPDLLESTGSVVAAVERGAAGEKYQWQPGWWHQHQRILAALSGQTRRKPLIVSGDLHALGIATINRSGELDLAGNPVHSVLSGPVGVGDVGWPSRARGVNARTPRDLNVTEVLALDERNGFTVLDFDRQNVQIDVLGCPKGWVTPCRLDVSSAKQLVI